MKNKIALITGGNRGLGKSMALKLAQKGTNIVLTYRANEKEAHDVVREIEKLGAKAIALRLDTTETSSFDSFAKRLKASLQETWGTESFHFLVNNAGYGVHASIEQTTEEQFDSLYQVHFKGVFFLTQKLLPLLSNGGRILNISSGLTRFSFPGYAAYASMKGAIEVFSRYLSKELGPRGISVNTIAPGAIATDFGGGAVRDNPQINAMIAGQTSLGRVGEAEDIGGAVAQILSEDCKWINAQRIEISGGMLS